MCRRLKQQQKTKTKQKTGLLPRQMGSCTPSSEDLISIFAGWMLLCEELIMAEDGAPLITTQQITAFVCSPGVLAGVGCVVTLQPKG